VKQLKELVPAEFGTYYEPFLGAGSLLLEVNPQRARLGDALEPLVTAWQAVASNPTALMARLEKWNFDKDTYDIVKKQVFTTDIDRAAQFLFLNRGAYGGLWRVNRAGTFNVPWSTPKTPSPVDKENILRVSRLLKNMELQIQCADFAVLTADAVSGDVVFLDPPYSKGRPERPFIHYNTALFGWADQVRLAAEAERLRSIGVHVLVTNSTHPDVTELYPHFSQLDVSRHSSLGSHPKSSRLIAERIFVSR
jgi:DNA adenine methylase